MPRHGEPRPGQGVVQHQAGAHVGAVAQAVLQRQQEGRGVDEVRGDGLHEQAALVEGLAHQADVEVLQVPQAAVDELARPARGAGGEVALLHQRHGEAATRRVERHATAGDSSADDEHVEVLAGEALQLALPRVSRRRPAAHLVTGTDDGHPGPPPALLVCTTLLVCTMTAVRYCCQVLAEQPDDVRATPAPAPSVVIAVRLPRGTPRHRRAHETHRRSGTADTRPL